MVCFTFMVLVSALFLLIRNWAVQTSGGCCRNSRPGPRPGNIQPKIKADWNVTFSTLGHYQVRQCEFSPPSETIAVSATPHIKAAPHTVTERRERRFCQICRLPKLQKETSNVLQNSQPLPAHPIPVARRHVSLIAGHHKRRDACDTHTTPQLRRDKTNKFHCQPFNFGFTDMSQTKLRPRC
jgi:hypothetical protein